jgi:hypothetical protein
MRILRRDALHELGFDHRCCRPLPKDWPKKSPPQM